MSDAAVDALLAGYPFANALGRISVTARAAGAYEVLLAGEVGADLTLRGVSVMLSQVPQGAAATFRVNSPGGSVPEGMAIFNAIRRFSGRKVMSIEGFAASMASLIAMAGDEIVMADNALMMIHNPSAITLGDSAAHERTVALLRQIEALMVPIYAARSGQSEDTIRAMMDAETWMDAQQAVQLGFADRVDTTIEAPAAHFDLSRFRNVPHALSGSPMPAPTPSPPAAPGAPAILATNPATLTELQGIAATTRGKLGNDWIIAQLQAGATPTAARDAAIDAIAAMANPPLRGMNPGITQADLTPRGGGDGGGLDAAIIDVLSAKLGGPEPANDHARELRGASVIQLQRARLEQSGIRAAWWSDSRVADTMLAPRGEGPGGHTTGDFPALLGTAMNRVLMASYLAAQSPLRAVLARVRPDVPDFRDVNVLRVGEAPKLKELSEEAEIEYGTIKEDKQTYAVKTYARGFNISRKALINDDLGAFADPMRVVGAAAAACEADVLVALLVANSGMGVNMSDGTPLFDASRGNVGTGDLSSPTGGLAAGRKAMRTTKGLDGITPIAVPPKYLLVSPDNETAAEQAVAQLTPRQVTDVNPLAGKLEVLVEPRLSGVPWFLFADPAMGPVFEAAYLSGNHSIVNGTGAGPSVVVEEDFDTLGLRFRCVLDFGAGAIGWRGAYRSTGVNA